MEHEVDEFPALLRLPENTEQREHENEKRQEAHQRDEGEIALKGETVVIDES
ncbi:MAG: hypothetical protein VW547_05755 [Alphaproteobacteria bacterium]